MAIATILLLFVGSNAEHLVILPIACVFAGIGECALFIFYSIALASKQPRGIVATLALSYVFAELTLVVFELILPANLAICAAALPFVSLFFFRKGAKSFSLETAFRAQKSPNCDGLFSGRRSALRVCPDEGIASLPPKLRAPTFEAEAMQNAPIFASTCRRSVIFVRCKPLSDTTFSSEPVRHREFQA